MSLVGPFASALLGLVLAGPARAASLVSPSSIAAQAWREVQSARGQDLRAVSATALRYGREAAQEVAHAVKNSTECEIRLLAYEYALRLRPGESPLLDVFDALELNEMCGATRPAPGPSPTPPSYPEPSGVTERFIVGKGKNEYETVAAALKASRASAKPGAEKIILVRGGVHYLDAPIALDKRDSGLTVSNYPGEAAELSGGKPLTTRWRPFNVSDDANVWVTDVDASVSEIPGLATESPHVRLIRARWPNANPEDRSSVKNVGLRDGLKSYIAPRVKPRAEQVWVNASRVYNASILWEYNGYSNGYCRGGAGDPDCPCGTWRDVRGGNWSSYSYHCAEKINGGWENMDQGNGYYNGPVLPLGLRYNLTSAIGDRAKRWSDPVGGYIVAWRAQGWFQNFYEISKFDRESGEVRWDDDKGMPQGGWQGGRGWQINGSTGAIEPQPNFFVENVFEELDTPGEYFFDSAKRKLYLWFNGTGAPPDGLRFVATAQRELLGVRGTAAEPASGITVRGLGFRDARETFSSPWGVPSGGDWALHRGGAVFVEGAEKINITGNRFERVDGNAVLLSGYTRDVELSNNAFSYIGDSAMAAWGYTDEHDGTGGEQPRRTLVRDNTCREIGNSQLQSSCWFQAKAAQTQIERNLLFNGPRAGINFNDGFGGGNRVRGNLIFNQCRHSGDHGPINSWDRQPFLTDVRDGTPSWVPAPTEVDRNFIIANYGGSQGFDNDDGSSFYRIHDNFIYGEGLKQDYGGHDSYYVNNVNIVHKYDGQNCINTWPFLATHQHTFANNTCVLLFEDHYGNTGACNPHNVSASICGSEYDPDVQCMPNLAENQYFTPMGDVNLTCGGVDVPLDMLQDGGQEIKSTRDTLPSNDQIIKWARDVLQMPKGPSDGW